VKLALRTRAQSKLRSFLKAPQVLLKKAILFFVVGYADMP
jgi:hypothetical protein